LVLLIFLSSNFICYSCEKLSLGDKVNADDIAIIETIQTDDADRLKQLALQYSADNNPEKSVTYILEYVNTTGDLSFINDHVFSNIKTTSEYLEMKQRFDPEFSFLGILYLFAGFLGFFIFMILGFKKDVDRVSTLLIGFFILFHSLFLLHFLLYVINIQLHLSHTLFISTTFSFLYGPLLYFYFKRTIFNYKFKWKDALHLIPSLLLLIYIFQTPQ
jgi:hypothetical protein